MTQHCKAWMIVLGLALTMLPAPAAAAEVHKLLPDDTAAVITVNVRQVLDSNLVKKHALELIKQALKDNGEVQQVLDAVGVDPVKDIDQAVFAAPELSEDAKKGLVIVSGRFDAAKVRAKAAEVAQKQADVLKIHKAGAYELYELKTADQPEPVFSALVDNNTLVAGPAKEYVLDALDKAAGKKKTVLKTKEIGALLERVDGKQGMWIAIGGSALEKGLPAIDDATVKEFLKKLDAIAGGLTVGDDVKAQFVLSAKDAPSAKELHQVIQEGIKQGIGALAFLAQGQKELAPVVDVVKSIKTSSNDKTVIITGTVPADLIEKALKMGQ